MNVASRLGEKELEGQADKASVDVSVVMPVVRPDSRPREVVEALSGVLEARGQSYEFILVIDGISGAGAAEAEALAKELPASVKCIRFQQPFGESACLSNALELLSGELVVTSPAYLQIVPEDLGLLLDAVGEGCDLAAPVRHPRIDPALNRFQSWAFNMLMRRVLRAPMHDLRASSDARAG